MAAFNTPPGRIIQPDPLIVGDPNVLTAVPDATVSYLFTTPSGFLVPDDCPDCPEPPGPPTTGQLWPRGNVS